LNLRQVTAAKTDQGRVRQNNEDNLHVSADGNLLVVADGMGGHASGEVASKMAVDIISDYLKKDQGSLIGSYQKDFSEQTNKLGAAVRLANMAIYEASLSKPGWQGMGTTIAAVFFNGGRLSIVHVGDSRIYLVRAGDISPLTDDHSLVNEQVKRDLLTKEEAAASDMKNILTRAVGIGPEVEVDMDELTIADGDILILCSDGLTSMVSDEDILAAVTSGKDPSLACERLVNMANEKGGRDNVTVITAYVEKVSWWAAVLKRWCA
jgi:serine/threonine protein phosphatase PrpC